MATTASERRLTLALAAASFLFFLLLNHAHFTGSDEVGVFAMTRSLVEKGSLEVPPLRHTERGRDGLRYSYFAPGQAVLAVPLYQLATVAEAVLPESLRQTLGGPRRKVGRHVYEGELAITFVGLYSTVVAAILVALFFRFERLLGASRQSALVAAALLAATTQLAILSTYFLRHVTEATCALAAVYFLVRWRQSGRTLELGLGASFASAILLVRIPAGLIAPPLALYLAWCLFGKRGGSRPGIPWSSILAILLPLAIALALHGYVNHIKWESWLASPMLGQHERLQTSLWVGLAGLLLSPGSSVFLYSPLLLLTPWTLGSLWRSHRDEALLFIAVGLTFLVVFARFDGWSGLWSAPGPRYLFLPIPLLMLPLGPWLDGGGHRLLAAVSLGAVGLWVQLVSTIVRWGQVPKLASYPYLSPDQSGVLFELDRSPVLVMTRLLFRGGPLDPWLLRVWQGWEGHAGRPGLALGLGLVWAVLFAAAAGIAIREARRDGEARS